MANVLQQFSISDRNNSLNDVQFKVFLDGNPVGSWVSRRGTSGTVKGMRVSIDSMRPFEFATLELTGVPTYSSMSRCFHFQRIVLIRIDSSPFTPLFSLDEEDTSLSRPDVSKLGIIEIQYFRVVVHGQRAPRPFRPREVFETGPVSEKAKKVGWHCASYVPFPFFEVHLYTGYRALRVGFSSLAAEQKTSYLPPLDTQYIDREPYFTFRIRYQPEGQCS